MNNCALEGTVVQTKHDLLHLTDPDLAHYLQKFNRYTTLAAQDMAASGKTVQSADVTVRPVFQFIKMYLLRRGLLDGLEGFILAVLSSAYVFTKYAKLWELTQGSTRRSDRPTSRCTAMTTGETMDEATETRPVVLAVDHHVPRGRACSSWGRPDIP